MRLASETRAQAVWSVLDNGTIYVTMNIMVEMGEYHDQDGHSPFREWSDRLNSEAARKVATAVYRLGLGNFSNAKSVGAGVYECRMINFGPTEYISGKTTSKSSSFLVVERSNASRMTFDLPSTDGKTTSRGRSNGKKRIEDGTDT
jgi:putative component of toxin-antitoxin plasmid stabilization module